jgi:hypothetical protein
VRSEGLEENHRVVIKGAIPEMNRSAKDGQWSSLHYGGEGVGFQPIGPRCLRATRWGRGMCDPGRPGIVRTEGMAEIL